MSFAANISSNIDALIREVELQVPVADAVIGEVVNPTEYAVYLNNRHGYYVMSDDVLMGYLREELEVGLHTAVIRGRLFGDDAHAQAVVRALVRTVAWYQSVIGTKNTAGKVKLPPRPMHPGQWADDTERLVNAYVTYARMSGRVVDFRTYENN